MNDLPKVISDVNSFTRWLNKIVAWMDRNTLQSSSDILVNATTHGTTLTLVKQRGNTTTVAAPSGGGWNYRGTYNPVNTYNFNDVTSMGSGTAAGMYLSLVDTNTNAPDSGIGWVQISTSAGTWL